MPWIRLAFLLSLSLSCSLAQEDTGKPLTLNQVLERMAERNAANAATLGQYTCVRRYGLLNHRFHKTAEITVRMTYNDPGRKTFEILNEKGLAIIRQRVLRRMIDAEEEASRDGMRTMTQITPRNYNFQLIGMETRQGRPSYVLSATPKSANKFLIQGRIWVDAEDFSIVHLEGAPAQNPSSIIRNTAVVHQYAKVRSYWLPLSNRSHSDSFLFGRTDVSIDYWDYKIVENPNRAVPASARLPLPAGRS